MVKPNKARRKSIVLRTLDFRHETRVGRQQGDENRACSTVTERARRATAGVHSLLESCPGMKGLFVQAKKAETGTKAFKFAFKLGGDDSGSEEEPTGAGSKKKKPNKRKKKKGTSTTSNGPEDAEAPHTAEETTQDVNGLEQAVGEMSVSTAPKEANNSTSEVTADEPAGTVLSKSQKKNAKRKAKKTDAQDGSPQPATQPAEAVSRAAASAGVGKATKTTKEAKKTATKENSDSTGKPAATAAPKLSQTSKGTTPSKGSNTKAVAPEKEDWELEIEKAIQANAQLAAEQRKAAKASNASPSKKAGGSSGGSSSGAPHFLSAKDPELDEATKQRYRFGMGRNLVAIGPAKVRDPNWLPPPPGLTKQTPTVTTAVGGTNINTAGAISSNSPGAGTDRTDASTSAAGAVEGRRCVAGAFSKKSAGAIGSNTGSSEADASNRAGDEVSHSSPFSFSFNGL